MSTRGVIARPKGDGWEGTFHGSDAYPSGLGMRLWDTFSEAPTMQGEAFVGELLQREHTERWDDEQADPLYFEWVYVLSGRLMTILGPYRIRRYAHRLVTQVALDGPEPDWLGLEREHRAWCEALPQYNAPAILEA